MTHNQTKKVSSKKKKSAKRAKKNLYNILLVMLLGVCAFSGYQIFKIYKDNADAKEVQNETSLTVEPEEEGDQPAPVPKPAEYRELFAKNKDLNNDFKGWIVFDSGLMNLPFVQGPTNDSYLRRNFYGQYDVCGTVFQDASQDLNGTNITLYGHYIYSDASLMFSPLEKLLQPENYEGNKTFHLYLENEVRDYEICSTVLYDSRGPNVPYEMGNFDDASWNTFYDMMVNQSVYNTGVPISREDHFLTMQTCVRHNNYQRTLVIGKETGRRPLDTQQAVENIHTEAVG